MLLLDNVEQKQRIAIPTFGTRISPRFDCASSITLVDICNNQIDDQQDLALVGLDPRERVMLLLSQGVSLVLCGGLRNCDAHALRHSGIRVIDGVVGEIDQSLNEFLLGTLVPRHPGHGHGHGRGRMHRESGRSALGYNNRRR
ncbi:MAG: NifB/NifX family molybdenum-iron cluster-binding protein [Candidatus Alcyoniella australis]|nr:NifB/NifX family molybdenum-iron cluster-binding protein [Candidatus Alcyoniella australis]